MSIYEYDEEKHMRQEREDARSDERKIGVKALIETCQDFGASRSETLSRVTEKFSLSLGNAEEYMNNYWKE